VTDARTTQVAVEEWGQGAPVARVTQAALEVWGAVTAGTVTAVVSQIAIEEWTVAPVVVPPSTGGQSAVTINTG
jgi:hypothetical protein